MNCDTIQTSVKRSIKDYLEEGQSLTVLTCAKLFQTNELRHFISELKRDGMEVKADWCYSEDRRKKWKVYYL